MKLFFAVNVIVSNNFTKLNKQIKLHIVRNRFVFTCMLLSIKHFYNASSFF